MNKLTFATALLAGLFPSPGAAEELGRQYRAGPSGPLRKSVPETPHAAHRTAEEANQKTRRRRKQRQKAAGKRR